MFVRSLLPQKNSPARGPFRSFDIGCCRIGPYYGHDYRSRWKLRRLRNDARALRRRFFLPIAEIELPIRPTIALVFSPKDRNRFFIRRTCARVTEIKLVSNWLWL